VSPPQRTIEATTRADRGPVALALLGLLTTGALVVGVGMLDAATVVSGLLALGLLVAMLFRPELSTHLVLFVVYTNVGVAVAQQGGVSGAVAGAIVGLLALPLAYHLVIRREELRLDTVFALMVVLLGLFAVSAALAIDPSTAFARIVSFVVEGLALYLLVLNVVRTLPTLRRVVWTLLAAGSLLGGLTLFQGVTRSYEQTFLGLAQSTFAFELDDDAPALDLAPAAALEAGAVTRAGGPMNEPNRFAQVLLVLLPLGLFQARFGRSRTERLLGFGAGALILAGVLLTYSRGAFLTLAVLVALAAALGYVRPSRIVLAAVILLIAVPVVAPGYYDRIGSITDALEVLDPAARTGAEAVARGRTTETLAAVHAFLDHPLLGVGPGHYLPHYSVKYQLDPSIGLRYLPEPRRAHNLFAEMAAESGLLGLLVFVSMPFVLLRALWSRRRELLGERPDLAFLATAFGLGILGYLGTGVFLHLAFERYYWLLLALAAATSRILSDRAALLQLSPRIAP
jgi:putative inorganic carbon (hco3(-)) transporter